MRRRRSDGPGGRVSGSRRTGSRQRDHSASAWARLTALENWPTPALAEKTILPTADPGEYGPAKDGGETRSNFRVPQGEYRYRSAKKVQFPG